MPRYNVIQVELTKIINNTPFNTLWIIWETDIRFNIVGTSSYIVVRTPDQLLSGSHATLVQGTVSSVNLPIGTYNIGTQSNQETISWWSNGGIWDDPGFWDDDNDGIYIDEFKLICGTVGYVLHITSNDVVMETNSELNIPNISETSIELMAPSENVLYPYINPIRPGGYGIGANYSQLVIRK